MLRTVVLAAALAVPLALYAADSVSVTNNTAGVVQLFYADPNGQETFYQEISPGQTKTQSTHAGHVWRVKDKATGALVKEITAAGGSQAVSVGAAEPAAQPAAVAGGQVTYWMGRKTGRAPREYTFDVPAPAAFANGVLCFAPDTAKFARAVDKSTISVNGRQYPLYDTVLIWEGNDVDKGDFSLGNALTRRLTEDGFANVRVSTLTPGWPACAAVLKAQARAWTPGYSQANAVFVRTDSDANPNLTIDLNSSAAGPPAADVPASESAPSAVPANTGSKLTREEAEEILAGHNDARKDVGVGPLRWSVELASYAQAWADECNRTGNTLQHRPNSGPWAQKYGENIGTVGSFYAEKPFYTPGTPFGSDGKRNTYGHYTQMVWRTTTAVGAGLIRRGGGHQPHCVFNYDPPGNYGDKPY